MKPGSINIFIQLTFRVMKFHAYSLLMIISLIPILSCERDEEPELKATSTSVVKDQFFGRSMSMSINLKGDEGDFIDSETAQNMVTNFLKGQADMGISNPKQAVFFGREKLLKLLNKEGAAGLTFYFGSEDKTGKLSLIIAASDENWNDIVFKSPSAAKKTGTLTDEDYLDHGAACCPIGK